MKRIFAPLPFLSILVLVIALFVLHQAVSSNAAAPSLTERATPVEPIAVTSALPFLQQLALKPNYMLFQGGTAASSLVGEWRFDEATGTSAADSSGRSLNGTLQNGPVWAGGRYRAGLQFDGVNDYVQVGAPAALVMTNAMSISAWICPTGTGAAGLGIIVNKEGEYEIARFYDGTIRWALANTAPGWVFIDTGFVAPVNQWTHIALTYNNGEVKTYANGNLVHTYLGSGPIGDVATSMNDFRIGNRQHVDQDFMGLIDEVSIYSQALTATDVTKLSQGSMLRNLALRKPATQSSTGWDSPASLAVDGNTDGDWYHGSVTHTDYNSQAWWQVDLGSVQQIDNVSVVMMTICCSSHDNFDVKVSSDGSNWTSYYVAGPIDHVNVPVNRTARYVRVQLRGDGYLALAEVQVWGVPGIAIPGVVQAEDFDDGGEGISYHDLSPANEGGLYRSTAVDVSTCVANDYVIGWNGSGEWTQYSINVLYSGNYTFQAVIGEESSGSLHVEIDGADRTGPITIPPTGSWCTYQTISKNRIFLSAGRHTMRVVTDNVGVVLDSFRLVAESTPYSGTAANIPGTVQVEAYDNGGEGIAYHDNSPSNETGSTFRAPTGVDVWDGGIGYAQAGEWLLYTVNVSTTGTYTVGASVGAPAAGASIHIEVDGVDKTGPMIVPNTGSWSSYQTITKSGVQLTAGSHTLRLVLDTNSGTGYVANFDLLNFTLEPVAPPNQPPKVSVGGPPVGLVGNPFQFSSEGSSDPDGTIASYSWNFGDGQTAGGANQSHTYAAGGNYTVTLTVTDNLGASSTATMTVAVVETTQSPYQNGVNSRVPGTIQAEDFDNGGPGIAYHDDSAGNQGATYRPGENVDIEDNTASNAGYAVGWTRAGEWLEYIVRVADTDNYLFEAQVASPADGGSGGVFHLEIDGGNKTGPITVPNTGGAWATVSKSGVRLSAGTHVLRVVMESGGSTGYVGRFDYFRFTATQSPYGGMARPLPGTIQAEDFDNGDPGTVYSDTTTGNQGGAYRSTDVDIWNSSEGPAVGWSQKGEWLDYTVDASQRGTYTVAARVASPGTGATFHLEIDGVDATGQVAVPATGSRDIWQTVQTSLKLSAGRHILRLVIDEVGAGGEVGFNSFEFSTTVKGDPVADAAIGPKEPFTDVDYASFGLGNLWNTGGGQIAVRGVGSVKKAYLYWWGTLGFFNPQVVIFANRQIIGTPMATSNPGSYIFGSQSFTFRADVTNIIAQFGNVNYGLNVVNCYGASLVVIHDDGNGSNNRDIMLYTGNDSNWGPFLDDEAGWNSALTNINYPGSGTAFLQLHVAEGETLFETPLVVTNAFRVSNVYPPIFFDPPGVDNFRGNSVPPNLDNGLWDIINFDVTRLLIGGTGNTLFVNAGLRNDILFIVLAVVNVPHPPIPPSVTITDVKPEVSERVPGNLDKSTRNALAGGQITLKATGNTKGTYAWTLTGPVENVTGLTSDTVSFASKDDGSVPQKNVFPITAKVTFTDENKAKAEATVNINAHVPALPVYTATASAITFEQVPNAREMIYQMGSTNPNNLKPAMTFNATASLPPGPYLSYRGQSFIFFQQAVSMMHKVRDVWGRVSCKTARPTQTNIETGWQHDGRIPRVAGYPNANKNFLEAISVTAGLSLTINLREAVEGVMFRMRDVDAAQVDDRYETYVIYESGNFVRRLGSFRWRWGGTVVFDTTVDPDNPERLPPPDTDVYALINRNMSADEIKRDDIVSTREPADFSSSLMWGPCVDEHPQPTEYRLFDNQHFYVRQLYLDFLQRDPDILVKDFHGWHYWTSTITKNAFDEGAIAYHHVNVALAFLLANDPDLVRFFPDLLQPRHTERYNAAFVNACYYGFLRRVPDQNGFDNWFGILNEKNHRTDDSAYFELVSAFLASIEYRNRRDFSPFSRNPVTENFDTPVLQPLP